MGEVRVTLKVRGITKEGRPAGARPVTVEAIVDTGASRTVVSRRVAREAGILLLEDVPGHITGAGGRVAVRVGTAVVAASDCGCEPEALLVAVSDRITKNARAEVVLGHDYMQLAWMLVNPPLQKAHCEKPPRAGKVATKRRTVGGKRAAARR